MSSKVTIMIQDKLFSYWTNLSINRSIDNIDTIEMAAPWKYEDKIFREMFKPFSYTPIQILVNDEFLFTGTMVPVNPQMTPEAFEIAIGAYSLPGILSECTMPEDSLPLHFKDQTLHEIAATLLKPWDLQIDARVPAGPTFEKVKVDPDKKVLPELAELAKKRNQILTSSEIGDLIFWQVDDLNEVVAHLSQDESPLLGITPAFNPQEFYSEITGLKPIRVRSKRSVKFTVHNPQLQSVFRPYIFRVPDIKDADLEQSVIAKAARMFANAVIYTVEVATWYDNNGNLWAPNTMVRCYAPAAMIYRPYDFIVKSVVFNKEVAENSAKEVASLELMLPNSFQATIDLIGWPWDE